MAKIELKTEELVGLLQQMQSGSMSKAEPASSNLGMEAPRRGAEENLGMFQSVRAANPVQSPAAPGTITEARRQSEEQAKLQREQMALQERLARLARAGQSTKSTEGKLQQVATLIKATTDAAAKEGRPFSDVVQALQAPASLGALEKYGVSMDQALQLAKQYYEPTLQSGNFASGVTMPLSAGPMNLMIPAQPELRQSLYNQGLGFDAQLEKLRNSSLDAALRDFQNYGAQPQKIEEGTYRDANGQIYHIDKWGNKTYAGSGIAGGTGGLAGLGK